MVDFFIYIDPDAKKVAVATDEETHDDEEGEPVQATVANTMKATKGAEDEEDEDKVKDLVYKPGC